MSKYELAKATVKLKGLRYESFATLKKLDSDRVLVRGTNGVTFNMSNYEVMTMFRYFYRVTILPEDEIEFFCEDDRPNRGCYVKCVSKVNNDIPDDDNAKNSKGKHNKPKIELLITIEPATNVSEKVIINVDYDHLLSKLEQIFYVFDNDMNR